MCGYILFCVDPHTFVLNFKDSLIDCCKHKRYADVTDGRILYYYKHVKTMFGYEQYLRSVFTKIRIPSQNLRVETCRYGRNRLERNKRKCLICRAYVPLLMIMKIGTIL